MPESLGAWSSRPKTARAAHLLERSSEIEQLTNAWQRARDGRGETVLLRGTAGIGKTALLRAVADRVTAEATVLHHRGTPSDSPHTYAAIVDLLSPAVFERLGSSDAPQFRGASELVLPLFQTGTAPQGGEFPLLHGLYWLMVTLCEDGPLVLLCDDVQWYDEPSIRTLAYLSERAGDLRLLIVAAQRGDGSGGMALDQLAAAAATLVEPTPLTSAAVSDLLPGAPSRVVAAMTQRSGGNPFLVHELIHAYDLDPATALAAIPASVVAMMELRLSRLPPKTRAVAACVAVLGDRCRVAEITAVLADDRASVGAALDELIAHGMIAQDGRPSFQHPLLRDAVLASLPPHHRLDLALRAARELSEEHPARAATQLLNCADLLPLEEPWVVETLRRACAVARSRGGPAEARGYLEQALLEPLEPSVELAVRHELGAVLHEMNDFATIEHFARAQDLADDPATAADVALGHAGALFHFAMLAESATVARSALAGLADDSEEDRQLALEAAALNAEALIGVNRSRPAALETAVSAADTPGRRAVLAHVAWDLAARGSRPHREVWQVGRQSLGEGQLLDDVGPASPLFVYAGTALAWAGDFPTARAHADQGIDAATRQGSLVGLAYATSLRAGLSIYQGDIPQAELDAQRVLDDLADADPMCFAMTLGWAMEVAIEQGDPERVLPLLTASMLDGDVPDFGTLDTMLLSRGRLWSALGQTDRALADFAAVGRRSEKSSYLSAACSPWRSLMAHVLLRTGNREQALELATAELELALAFGAPRAIGVALQATAAARLTDEDRVQDLSQAVDVLADSGARLVQAEVLISLSSQPSYAPLEERRALLRQAMDRAHRCGSARVVSTAMQVLRATGARPRRPSVRGVDALTRQERQAAQHAARGLGNREIAEAMFLTRRTIELHLTNTYRKLGIHGRDELAASLEGHGGG